MSSREVTSPTLSEVAPGIWSVEKDVGGGWHNAMFVVRLRSGGLLIHSPTRLGDGVMDQIAALGPVEVLFAPNHFHHLGLPRYRQQFPDAKVVASAGARPRLEKKGHAGIVDLAEVEPLLPEGARFLRCEGLKNGEVFLSLDAGGTRTWIVCDAFFHETRPTRGARSLLFRALGVAPGLKIGRTFQWVGLADTKAYRAWLDQALERERPKRILVSHGTPIEIGDGSALRAEIRRGLG
jgi:hypothetical protein